MRGLQQVTIPASCEISFLVGPDGAGTASCTGSTPEVGVGERCTMYAGGQKPEVNFFPRTTA